VRLADRKMSAAPQAPPSDGGASTKMPAPRPVSSFSPSAVKVSSSPNNVTETRATRGSPPQVAIESLSVPAIRAPSTSKRPAVNTRHPQLETVDALDDFGDHRWTLGAARIGALAERLVEGEVVAADDLELIDRGIDGERKPLPECTEHLLGTVGTFRLGCELCGEVGVRGGRGVEVGGERRHLGGQRVDLGLLLLERRLGLREFRLCLCEIPLAGAGGRRIGCLAHL
jgi:hypothetical protein